MNDYHILTLIGAFVICISALTRELTDNNKIKQLTIHTQVGGFTILVCTAIAYLGATYGSL